MKSIEMLYGRNSNPLAQYDYMNPIQVLISTSPSTPYAKIIETDVQLNPYKFRDGERQCTGVISEFVLLHSNPYVSGAGVWPTASVGKANFRILSTGLLVGSVSIEKFGNSQNSAGELLLYAKKSTTGGTTGNETSYKVQLWVKSEVPLLVKFPFYIEEGVATQRTTIKHNAYASAYTRAYETIKNVDNTPVSESVFNTAVINSGFSAVDLTTEKIIRISESTENISLKKHTRKIVVENSSSTIEISRLSPSWDSGDIEGMKIDVIALGNNARILHTEGTATEMTGNNIKCPGDTNISMVSGQIITLERFAGGWIART